MFNPRCGLKPSGLVFSSAPSNVAENGIVPNLKIKLFHKKIAFVQKDIDYRHPYQASCGITEDVAKTFGIGVIPGRRTMHNRLVIPIENERKSFSPTPKRGQKMKASTLSSIPGKIIVSTENLMSDEEILAQYDLKVDKYKQFTKKIQELLTELLSAPSYRIRLQGIEERTKERTSLLEKLKRYPGKYAALADITDLSGVRVITYFHNDIDLVKKFIDFYSDLLVDQAKSIDKREALQPEEFGYSSLHCVVSLKESRTQLHEYKRFAGLKAEVQIRSLLNHSWAAIQHTLVYKKPPVSAKIARKLASISALLEIADDQFNAVRTEIEAPPAPLPFLRNLGITEAVGEFLISIPRVNLLAVNEQHDLVVGFNTNVTNRLFKGTSTGIDLFVENAGVEKRPFKGLMCRASAVSFAGVFPLRMGEGDESVLIRVRGARVNAAQLGFGLQTETIQVVAAIWTNPRGLKADPVKLIGFTEVALVKNTVRFAVKAVNPSEISANIEDRNCKAFTVCFSEGFRGAFKNRANESAEVMNDADHGTRFQLTMNLIPLKVNVYVTHTNIAANDVVARHIDADTPRIKPGQSKDRLEELIPIDIFGGSGTAVWEWESSMKNGASDVSFGLVLMTDSADALTDHIILYGSLAPLSTVHLACSSSPIPRFVPVGESISLRDLK